MDEYKKNLSLLQSSVPFLPHLVRDSLVPPVSTRRRQSRPRAQHKYQWKIKRGTAESKKKEGNSDNE